MAVLSGTSVFPSLCVSLATISLAVVLLLLEVYCIAEGKGVVKLGIEPRTESLLLPSWAWKG